MSDLYAASPIYDQAIADWRKTHEGHVPGDVTVEDVERAKHEQEARDKRERAVPERRRRQRRLGGRAHRFLSVIQVGVSGLAMAFLSTFFSAERTWSPRHSS